MLQYKSVSNNVKAEVATDCAKHGNVKAEVAARKVEVATGKAEVATDCAKYGNVKAEVAARKVNREIYRYAKGFTPIL